MKTPKQCTCCDAADDIECPCSWGWQKLQLFADPPGIFTWRMQCKTHGREWEMGKGPDRKPQEDNAQTLH